MKEQEITSILYELYKITGFRISLHDVNFAEIAAYPKEKLPICSKIHETPGEFEKCRIGGTEAFRRARETGEAVIYKCRYGLTEAVSPLYNFGTLTGYLMIGQICDGSTDPNDLKKDLSSLPSFDKDALGLVDGIRTVNADMIQSYVKIMTLCAQYITLSNAMTASRPTAAEAAKKYISENLNKKITIKSICDEVGCSKTTLIASFKKEFGTTVNAAITAAKLNEARKLLSAGKMSINEVAQATGFLDQSYFSKVFLAECGISPSEYKKEGQK